MLEMKLSTLCVVDAKLIPTQNNGYIKLLNLTFSIFSAFSTVQKCTRFLTLKSFLKHFDI